MIAPDFLKILVCPQTHQPLTVASGPLIESLNRGIAAGRVTNRGGRKVVESMESGLVRLDGKALYAIRNKLPILLIDEAIPLPS